MDSQNVAILVFLSFLMFRVSNSLQVVFLVTNDFTSENSIEVRFTSGSLVVGVPTVAEARVTHKESLSSTVNLRDDDKFGIACKCGVTEFGKFGARYYGFFEVSSSHPLDNTFKVSVNEEGAFMYTQSSGYQLLHAWLKQQFYVYNLFDKEVKLTALAGVQTYVKVEKVRPGNYLHWTRIINERNINQKPTYKCRVNEAKNNKVIEVFNSTSLDDVALLKKCKTLYYRYGVNETGIGYFNPETSEYTHLRNWP